MEKAGDDGDAAGYGRSVDELHVVLAREAHEGGAAVGDELLVGRDDGLAGGDGLAEPGLDGVEAAHELDDDVDIGGEDVIDIFRPEGGLGDELCVGRGLLALDVAVIDVGELEASELAGGEDLCDGASDGAEA